MTVLKPCPYCGAPVGKVYADLLYDSRIECISCGGQVRCATSQDSDIESVLDYLVNTWNKRVKE